jgi:hypothetical protein
VRRFVIVAIPVVVCFTAIFAYLSVESSRQVRRDRERQEFIRQFDEQQHREATEAEAGRAAWRLEHPGEQHEARQLEPFNEDAEIANLKSSDREVLNQAIQKLQVHKVCQVVPDLMEIMKTTTDDYIAAISAGAIADCKQPSTYPAIVDEFLQLPAVPALIRAVGETGSQDDRVYAKLHKLITSSNDDPMIPSFARHAKQQIDIMTQTGAQQR